jgi:diguanylate cyclase (GGDEF)-like protein
MVTAADARPFAHLCANLGSTLLGSNDWELTLLDGLVELSRIFDVQLAGVARVEGASRKILAVDSAGHLARCEPGAFEPVLSIDGVTTRSFKADAATALFPKIAPGAVFSLDCRVDVDSTLSLLLADNAFPGELDPLVLEQLKAILGLIALAHGRQLERSRAFSDALTGLFGRRYLDAALPAEVERARRHRVALTLVMVDLDHFKSINDSEGHTFGDRVLRAFAGCLNAELRRSDIAIRYGGDEFVLLLPGTNLEGAQLVMGRIRNRLMGVARELQLNPGKLTISVGMACAAPFKDEEILFEEADRNLYRAKRLGRNRSITPATGTRQFDSLPSLPENPVLLRPALDLNWEEDHTPN